MKSLFKFLYRVALDCNSQELAVRTWEQQINLSATSGSIKIAPSFIRRAHQKIFKNKALRVLPDYLLKEGLIHHGSVVVYNIRGSFADH